MNPFEMRRIGEIMSPEPGNPKEAEGVLNPAAIRGPDGHLYLFPRLVETGNYSRIGIARVKFNSDGDPDGVERIGIALQPEADYELRREGVGRGGGCEDARVTYVEPLGHYVMTYTALSTRGPRIALAESKDLIHWQRLGLATFRPYRGIAFDGIDNKDACLFPVSIPNPEGKPALALLHRPLFPGTRPEEKVEFRKPRDIHRESIWISYRNMHVDRADSEALCHFTSHHRLASPAAEWEQLKIGVGAPPILTKLGWVVVYHGVSEVPGSKAAHPLQYAAGVMVLLETNPQTILYRTPQPVLTPTLPHEQIGTIGQVVFPTGIDRRDDLHTPNRLDIYYGMADDRIGAATLSIPDNLPSQSTQITRDDPALPSSEDVLYD